MNPLPIRLLPEARQEFDDAIDWYAQRDKSLAIDFVIKIRNVFNRIAVLPKMHHAVIEMSERLLLNDFRMWLFIEKKQWN